MKVELKIEAAGVQVYAYEINEEAKKLLKENADNVFRESGIPELDEEAKKRIKENADNGFIHKSGMEIVEEHGKVTLMSLGIALRHDKCKYSVLIDGEEKPFYPAYFEFREVEEFEDPDRIKEAIEMSDWPDTVDPHDYVWDPEHGFKFIPGSEAPIPEGHAVIFEVIPYSSGTLHTSLEADDDFKLSDLKIVTDDVDIPPGYKGKDHDLAWLYYCDVFGDAMDENKGSAFDENTVRRIDYKGERHDFELDFQGGAGSYYTTHEKGESGWGPSFLVNSWLDEG